MCELIYRGGSYIFFSFKTSKIKRNYACIVNFCCFLRLFFEETTKKPLKKWLFCCFNDLLCYSTVTDFAKFLG